MVKNKYYTQNDAVIKYMRKRHSSKLTTEQICKGIKTDFNKNLTIPQVSKCLNRFSVKNLVTKIDSMGSTTDGRKAYRWKYVPTKG